MTRRLLLRTLGLLGFGAAAGARAAAQAPPPSASAEKTVWYFYRVKWGFQSEFETLFWRNHYPVLMEGQKRGRITGVKVYAPTYHGDGRSDWTLRPNCASAAPKRLSVRPATRRSPRSFTPTRRSSARKSSAASRSSTRTGTCRSTS
jgi:hypothetical protein